MAKEKKLTESQQRISELSDIPVESSSYNGVNGQTQLVTEDAIANYINRTVDFISSKGLAGSPYYITMIQNALTGLSQSNPYLYKQAIWKLRQGDVQGLSTLLDDYDATNQQQPQQNQQQSQQQTQQGYQQQQ